MAEVQFLYRYDWVFSLPGETATNPANPAHNWRIQVDCADEMGLTVADWRATTKRNPAPYEWAIPFLKDRFDGEFVAPILRDALNYPK